MNFLLFFLLSLQVLWISANSCQTALPCCGHGHKENNVCVCMSLFEGNNCESEVVIKESVFSKYNESHFSDWKEIHIRRRIKYLYNLEPYSKKFQYDGAFPENYSSIDYAAIDDSWISLKNEKYQLFSNNLDITDIKQGGLPNCFFLSALASIVNLPNGQNFIRDAIPYYNESSSVYITKWFLFGRYIYVSVNDLVPGDSSKTPYFAKISPQGNFWVAILEKAWAKIWGNYRSSLTISEDVVWNALTGATERLYFDLTQVTTEQSFNLMMDLDNFKLATIKSKPTAYDFVGDHSFSILGKYSYNEKIFLKVYNPWGLDVVNNTWNDKNAKALTNIPIEEKNDGKFLIEFSDFIKYFDRIIAVAPRNNFKTYSFPININDDLVQNFELPFKFENRPLTSIYFDILNDGLSEQIQPYSPNIISLKKKMMNFLFPVGDTIQLNSLVYKGLKIVNAPTANKNDIISFSFSINRYNQDIGNQIFLNFYSAGSITPMIDLKSLNSQITCSNNCNSNGKCESNKCVCNSNYFGKACSLTQALIEPNVKCNCNGNGACLSTGKCICKPGFDPKTSCLACKDSESLCVSNTALCFFPTEAVKCPKTCLLDNCYIPGQQTACEVNKCYGRGMCTTRGTCIMCMKGYYGNFCENGKRETNEFDFNFW